MLAQFHHTYAVRIQYAGSTHVHYVEDDAGLSNLMDHLKSEYGNNLVAVLGRQAA